MSKMTWFKLHSEFRNDPKVKRLPITERYAFIILLCLASESETRGVITGLDDDDIAFEIEMQSEDWKTLKAKFKVKGFIDFNQSEILIQNWDKRQYDKPSDHPEATKQRKRLQRERDKLAKAQDVTPCHADVTPMSRGREEEIRLDQIRSDQDSFFLEAQEKKIDADCKIEISLPEEKKESLPLKDDSEDQDPTPLYPPAPPLRNFPDPQGDRFRDRGNRGKEIEVWIESKEFLGYLLPIVIQYDAYKKNGIAGVKKFVRVAEQFNDRGNARYIEAKDYYEQFLDSQQRSQHQQPVTTVEAIPVSTMPTTTAKEFAAKLARKAS